MKKPNYTDAQITLGFLGLFVMAVLLRVLIGFVMTLIEIVISLECCSWWEIILSLIIGLGAGVSILWFIVHHSNDPDRK